ncbi:MAG: shikimate kinase [Candidatus Omnitrophota bacterium]
MKNIYLVGFMGTGKTTVGKLLANKLHKKFVELDELIEKKEHKKIADIFSESGEKRFRQIESELLKNLSLKTALVVSCGGGLICNDDNARILKNTGIVFNLSASSETIYNRTKNFTHRPLLNVKDPLAHIKTLLRKRKPYYARAHYTIDTEQKTPEEVANAIVAILSKFDRCENS